MTYVVAGFLRETALQGQRGSIELGSPLDRVHPFK